MERPLTFEEFVRLCFEADSLLKAIRASSRARARLGGRRSKSLKAGALRYLAKERGLPVTLHQLFLVYGVSGNVVADNERLIRACVHELDLDLEREI